jgi:hypothetical protein
VLIGIFMPRVRFDMNLMGCLSGCCDGDWDVEDVDFPISRRRPDSLVYILDVQLSKPSSLSLANESNADAVLSPTDDRT